MPNEETWDIAQDLVVNCELSQATTKAIALVDEAQRELSDIVIKQLRWNDGCVPECCDEVNDASRRMVNMIDEAYGEAWLGVVNIRGNDRKDESYCPVWKWDGSLVCNFECAFVSPVFDQKLVDLIIARDRSDYIGTAADAVRIEDIFEQIFEIGAICLHWS